MKLNTKLIRKLNKGKVDIVKTLYITHHETGYDKTNADEI